jgi:hypothetical protein
MISRSGRKDGERAETFLIGRQGQAWPLLSTEQAYERVNGYVDVGETVKGAAKPLGLLGATGTMPVTMAKIRQRRIYSATHRSSSS